MKNEIKIEKTQRETNTEICSKLIIWIMRWKDLLLVVKQRQLLKCFVGHFSIFFLSKFTHTYESIRVHFHCFSGVIVANMAQRI